MKLIRKLNKQYVIYSFGILLVTGIALFFTLKLIVDEETDEKLVNIFNQIKLLIKEKPQSLNLYPIISVQQVSSSSNNQYFSDTTLYVNNELEQYRQLVGYTTIKNINYKIIIRESGIESEDLFETLALIIILGFLFLILSLYIINKRIAKNIWLPFFENLEKLKRFSLQSLIPFNPTKTDTDEFNEMNIVLKVLTDKVISDYNNLKKFSENASHELQTPLAIIHSKIEALLGETSLTSVQLEKIQAIRQTVTRLSKINRGLILLTKIENRQFPGYEEISLNEVIKAQINSFNELLAMQGHDFKYYYQTDRKIKGDKALLEMLVNNLLGNAILHTNKKGKLTIELNNHLLKFSNTGKEIIPESKGLFERFNKKGATGSTGLGLAISKQICLSLGWSISYDFENQMHVFKITF